ncbi:MAG: hypothetical protein M3Q06_09510 [Bacteroidota bacterium]|nr:hypothetical protein [Bacteroidota bacterium]
MKIFSTAALLALCLFLLSCQKEDKPTPTKTDHISASAWKYDGGGVDGNKDGTIDLTFPPGTLDACRTDNTLKFEKNGTGVTDEGTLKCSTSDPQTSSFTWSFTGGETSLVMGGNIFSLLNGTFKVLDLNATSFRLSKDTVLSGQNVAVIVNLKH